MARIKGPVITHKVESGFLRTSMAGDAEQIGDRWVPSPIEVHFPGMDGQPELVATIENVNGVPRWTEITLRRIEDGREIRPLDLRALYAHIESWLEQIVATVSGEVVPSGEEGVTKAVHRGDEASFRSGMRTIRDVRKGSRRPMTSDRVKRVAEVYNAHATGGIEAIEAAFGVSRSTAVRYIKAAREAALIERRE